MFSFGVAYIAHRGVNGSTAVNIAINVIQIIALLVFSRDGARLPHEPSAGQRGLPVRFRVRRRVHLRVRHNQGDGERRRPPTRSCATPDGVPQPKLDAAGKPVPYHMTYPEQDASGNFLSHPNAWSVVRMHNFGWVFVQATVAILILVGFESVTSMGGEAKNRQT